MFNLIYKEVIEFSVIYNIFLTMFHIFLGIE